MLAKRCLLHYDRLWNPFQELVSVHAKRSRAGGRLYASVCVGVKVCTCLCLESTGQHKHAVAPTPYPKSYARQTLTPHDTLKALIFPSKVNLLVSLTVNPKPLNLQTFNFVLDLCSLRTPLVARV